MPQFPVRISTILKSVSRVHHQGCLYLLLLCCPFYSIAQHTINTDRPDQSDGSHIVETHFLQIETGMQFSRLDSATKGFDNVSLFRYGITKKFEIRLQTQYSSIADGSGRVSGVRPLTLSAKNRLWVQHGLLPKATLVSYLKLPFTISPLFPGKNLGYAFTMVFRYDLSSGFKIYTNIGINRDQESKEVNYVSAAEVNYSITPKLSAFVEYFGSYQKQHNAGNGLDAGMLYAFQKNLQVDIALGSPTTRWGRSRYITTGISFRLPE